MLEGVPFMSPQDDSPVQNYYHREIWEYQIALLFLYERHVTHVVMDHFFWQAFEKGKRFKDAGRLLRIGPASHRNKAIVIQVIENYKLVVALFEVILKCSINANIRTIQLQQLHHVL
jgi:hypothetical protein